MLVGEVCVLPHPRLSRPSRMQGDGFSLDVSCVCRTEAGSPESPVGSHLSVPGAWRVARFESNSEPFHVTLCS